MINCHAHLFNSNHVPEELLKLYVKWLPNFAVKKVSQILNSKVGNFLLGWTNKLGNEPLKRYGNFLKFGYGMNIEEQFNILKNAYPKDTRFVILMQNFAFISNYQPLVAYEDYKKEIYKLKCKYPKLILPFYFIEPRLISYQDNPQKLLTSFIDDYERGLCQGLKMYPAEGYFPFDYRILAIYEYAAENEIPIMTHVSRGGSRYVKQTSKEDNFVLDLYKKDFNPNLPKLGWFNKDYTGRASRFTDPENFIKVLDHPKLRNLKICLAHSGSIDEYEIEIKNRENNTTISNWYRSCLEIVDKYPNVYMDISFSLTDNRFLTKLIKKDFDINDLDETTQKRCKRLLFGTDFYMTYTEFDSENRDLSTIENKLFKNTESILGYTLFKQISLDNAREYLTSKRYQ